LACRGLNSYLGKIQILGYKGDKYLGKYESRTVGMQRTKQLLRLEILGYKGGTST
jgi:hypothetical protein